MTPAAAKDLAEDRAKVTELALAKVNLYLHVLGRRADGYHELDSLAVFPAVADRISVRPASTLTLSVDGPFASAVPTDTGNLVMRAAAALAAEVGRPPAVHIHLTKALPVASGIGGGSADAAAALRALTRLWHLDGGVDLAPVALRLGADVPMCLASRSAFVGGIGERLEAAPPLPPFALVLVNPGVAIWTPEVFKRRQGPFSAPARFPEPPADAAALARVLAERGNDLTQAARALAPEVGSTLEAMAAEAGVLLARMSGSGATCWGLCADEDTAAGVAASLAREHPGWWVTSGTVVAAAVA